jgi:serine/threonine protein kinase
MDHPNVVRLHEVVVGPKRDAVFLLFEYCEHDLSKLIRAVKNPFKESEVKCLIRQLLSAVVHLHSKWIVHRDIKLSNLLYNSKGQLKLADFGLARTLSHPAPAALTQTVVTLWYRAPEVLLGTTVYSFPIDIWSVGCILGELLLNQPLLPGNSELDQLKWIFHLLGKLCPCLKLCDANREQ